MAGKINYAYLDEAPVIFDDDKAFQFVGGKWKPLHMADAVSNARLLKKKAWDSYATGAGATQPYPIT